MKKSLIFASALTLLAAQTSATEVERWSVRVGNTYVATVKVDGVAVQPNTNGMSSRVALSESATTAWAEQRYDNVRIVPYEPFIPEDLE
jgi:hypothetical protein